MPATVLNPTSSLNRFPEADFGPPQARHLLLRAGFGAAPDQIASSSAEGLGGTVRRVMDFQAGANLPAPDVDPDVIKRPSAAERRKAAEARRAGRDGAGDALRKKRQEARRRDRQMHTHLQEWWIDRMISTPAPLQEKLTLLWHGHFASRHRNVRDAYLMHLQNEMFRREAVGSFASMATGIVRDPAMLKFLNNDRNVARKPNENLARELMELFTLGEGEYSERDIKEGARALTGYHVNDNDFRFRSRVHDDGEKRILGRRGAFDGDDFVRILLRRKQCARHVAFKLYRCFVADVEDDPDQWPAAARLVIDEMGDRLFKGGYEIGPVLEALLMSRHFYDPAVVGLKIKSPAQLLVGTVRSMSTPAREPRVLRESMRMMGQQLFDPPSVAGWDGGRAWVNTSTLFVRQNLCTYLLTGKRPGRGDWTRGDVAYDPLPLLSDVDRDAPGGAVVDHLVDAYLGPHIPAARREPLVRFMAARSKGVTADSVVALLSLITATPEYQLC